jgi:predicted RNA methylase
MNKFSEIENERLELQSELDKCKTQKERNQLGQFATPTKLAVNIVKQALKYIPKNSKIQFFDPAIGTGSFYSALHSTVAASRIKKSLGFEIDACYAEPTINLWAGHELSIRICDFTKEFPLEDNLFNLIVCNPPYVRHHHIINGDKARLQKLVTDNIGISVSGLAGLYCYFLLLSKQWMKQDGIAAWLIPSEFMDVNYGKAIKEFLLNKVELLKIHRSDPKEVEFDDALVSSAIVFFRNSNSPKNHKVEFTFGGTINKPKISKKITLKDLAKESKWTRFPRVEELRKKSEFILSDFFSIKRGLATGDNNFFILTKQQIEEKSLPLEAFKPVLPSPRNLKVERIDSDHSGLPVNIKQLYLLDCSFTEDEIQDRYPTLWDYLEEGKKSGVDQRYLCKHRKVWYSQENRKSSPFLCTYMGRGSKQTSNPFRFILNNSKARATNVYLLLYPKKSIKEQLDSDPELLIKVWNFLNEISADILTGEGRVYGGGLHKLEPRELANVPATELDKIFNKKTTNKNHQLFLAM